jgi:glycosyl transferase family 9 (putative heptosyltransferase)
VTLLTFLGGAGVAAGDGIWQARYVADAAREPTAAGRITCCTHPTMFRLFARLGVALAPFPAYSVNDTAPWLLKETLAGVEPLDRRWPIRPHPHVPGRDWPPPPPPAPLWADPTAPRVAGTAGPWVVGLCMTGSRGPSDPRGVPAELLRPLLAVPGVTWVALHLADHLPLLRALPEARHIPSLADYRVRDWADTAGIVAQLDLVITVDTAVAHLAASLDRPTWVLAIPFPTDGSEGWVWPDAPFTTAWYPSARVFRCAAPGAWAPLVAQVAAALEEEVRRKLTTALVREGPAAFVRAHWPAGGAGLTHAGG